MMIRWLAVIGLFICGFTAFADDPPKDAPKMGWKNESEAGVVVTGGNTNTQSYHVTDKTEYLFESKNTATIQGRYLDNRQNGAETAENWEFGIRYDRSITEMFGVFIAQNEEGDKFSGYLQRYNSDLGAKYYLYKIDKNFNWFVEGGGRYTHEHDTDMSEHDYLKGRAYVEAEKYLMPSTSGKLWLEYLPNFTFPPGWQFNGEASINSAMNSIFSIKLAYLYKYNNAPPPGTPLPRDTQFTTALVAKF